MEKTYKYAEEWSMYPGDEINCKTDKEKEESGMMVDKNVNFDFPLTKTLIHILELGIHGII